MATNKRKQDEKHLKMLREMVSFPSNKQCFDCSQRGPTYVNMTIGSFVCTSCSGILRGLHPPHRIKSISMASFTPEEMDFLKSHGNELNRKVYLGLHDSQTSPEPDSRDEQRVREHMVQKYENKRWYVAPTDAMREEAKWTNEAALNSKPQVKPLRSLLGENASKLTAVSNQTPTVTHVPVQVSVPLPGGIRSPPPASIQTGTPAAASTAPTKASSGFDLLADLGGDPFASSAPANSNGNVDGFADFSNFGSMNSSPSHQAGAAQVHASVALAASQAFPVSSAPLQPSARGQAATPTSSQQPPTSQGFSAGDRYAALANLDSSLFSAPVTTAAPINWGGSDGGAISWGSTGSNAGTPSHNATASNIPGGPINWNNQGPFGMPMATTGPSSGYGAPSAAVNPFSGASPGPRPTYSSAAGSGVNPFGTSSAMSQFPQSGAQVSAGYGGQFAQHGQLAGGFGQFPGVQNGGFGISAAGYGQPGSFSQQQMMMGAPNTAAVQQSGSWTQLGSSSAASQPVSNPFMNTAIHHQIPPSTGSTNPFL